MLTSDSLTPQSSVFKCKVDGVVKTIAGRPITGAMLYVLAGHPERLEAVSGELIADTHETITTSDDMEFITKSHMAPNEVINPEHILTGDDGPKVDPPHSITEHNYE